MKIRVIDRSNGPGPSGPEVPVCRRGGATCLFRLDVEAAASRSSRTPVRAGRFAPPFVLTRLSERPAMLVVENSAAFATFGRLLADGRLAGIVAYGAGKHFIASVAYALELSPRPARVLYFGDLDGEGLSIPARAAERAAALGLPRVEPAAALYELLLAQPPRQSSGRSRRDGVPEVAWLPEPLRRRAAAVLAAGRRIPQEAVGFELLAGDPAWRAGLAAQLATAVL